MYMYVIYKLRWSIAQHHALQGLTGRLMCRSVPHDPLQGDREPLRLKGRHTMQEL